MPLITCEMRWLLDGALPQDAERWFQRGREPAVPVKREDRYLLLPGVADMGIKEREGRLEIKGRLAVLKTHAITPEIEGRAERWCKWSHAAAPIAGGCFRGEAVIVAQGARAEAFSAGAGAIGGIGRASAGDGAARPHAARLLARADADPSSPEASTGRSASRRRRTIRLCWRTCCARSARSCKASRYPCRGRARGPIRAGSWIWATARAARIRSGLSGSRARSVAVVGTGWRRSPPPRRRLDFSASVHDWRL